MALAVAAYPEPQPAARTFHFEHRALVKEIPAGAKRLELWLPVPRTDTWQQVTNLRIESPYPYASSDSDGNMMIHIGIDHPRESTFAVTLGFDAVRKEHRRSRLSGAAPLREHLSR